MATASPEPPSAAPRIRPKATKIYIAGISGETQYVKSLRTFYEIQIRPGDYKQERASGRGDVARSLACEEFLEGKLDAVALFDLDMLHPPDILERLRSHDVDMVTGHYYARNARNIHSVCSVVGDGKWPFPPMLEVPRSGLHEIAISGMGCVLIQRRVVEAVLKRLPPGDNPFGIGPLPEATGDGRSLGSDFRFFTLARILGYRLWLDASIESRHALVVWLNHDIAERLKTHKSTGDRLGALAGHLFEFARKGNDVDAKALELRIKMLEERQADLKTQKNQAEQNADFLNRQLIAVSAVIADEKWLLEQMQSPQSGGQEEQFPIATEEEKVQMIEHRMNLADVTEADAREARSGILRKEAAGFVDDIDIFNKAK